MVAAVPPLRSSFLTVCAVVVAAILLSIPDGADGFFLPHSSPASHHFVRSPSVKALRQNKGVQELIFNQKLDHFNFQERRTFKQRYFIDDQYWNGTGPAFFYVGAETTTSTSTVTSLVLAYYAKMQNGLIISAEHRYYGESRPFGDQPTNEQLGWLSVEQALADYAAIVKHVIASYNTSIPVYCVGGSYGGFLSAVLRMKYGNVFWGSIASAAPILAEVTEPEEWFHVVSNTFMTHDAQCGKTIRSGFRALAQQATTPVGRQSLAESLGLCFALETEEQAMDALYWGVWGFSFLSEFNFPYPILWASAPPVDYACQLLNQNAQQPGLAVASTIRWAFNFSTSPVPCFNSTDLWHTGASAVLQVREWRYQVCTVMSIPAESDGVRDIFLPFPWKKTFVPFVEECQKIYNTTPDLSFIETYLIGHEMRAYSRVIFTRGTFDPAAGYAPRTNITPSLISLTSVAAHCQDLYYPTPLDSPSLQSLRQNVQQILAEWTQEFYQTPTGRRVNS